MDIRRLTVTCVYTSDVHNMVLFGPTHMYLHCCIYQTDLLN